MKRPSISRRHDRCKPIKCPGKPGPAAPEEKRKKGPKEGKGTGNTIVAAIREYFSEILGSFIPGVYFSLNLVVSTVLLLLMLKGRSWEKVFSFFTQFPLPAVFQAVMPFAVFAFCLFSYVIGSAFCRKDLKEPDTASAIRTYQMSSPEERKGLAFDFGNSDGKPLKLSDRLCRRINFRVDFPYSRLKRYLTTRNYTHLAKHIPWEGNEKDAKHRSKMFINILKARLHRYAPLEMPGIEKNEAHIRLMNSLWYAAKSIRNISIPVLASIVCYYVLPHIGSWTTFLKSFETLFEADFAFYLEFFSAIQLLVSRYIRRSIKQYFHYMRVREIVFLLEIADTVSKDIGKDLFEGLMEPDNKEPDTAMPPDTTK